MHVTFTLRRKKRGREVCLEVKIDLWKLALLALGLGALLH
jgi:hypothetical protein